MSYKDWFEKHGKKHREIIERLSHLNDDEVIEYLLDLKIW